MKVERLLILPTFHEIEDISVLAIDMEMIKNTPWLLIRKEHHLLKPGEQFISFLRLGLELCKHVDLLIHGYPMRSKQSRIYASDCLS